MDSHLKCNPVGFLGHPARDLFGRTAEFEAGEYLGTAVGIAGLLYAIKGVRTRAFYRWLRANHRWIVAGKLCLVLDQVGRVVAWDRGTANVYEATFHHLIEQFADQMIILGEAGFHSAQGDPANLKICRRGAWNERMQHGDRAVDAHRSLSHQEDAPGSVGRLQVSSGVSDGWLQHPGAVDGTQAC